MKKIKEKTKKVFLNLCIIPKICASMLGLLLYGCGGDKVSEQEQLDIHVKRVREDIEKRATLIYLNRIKNRNDEFKLDDENLKNEIDTFTEEMDLLKKDNPDLYNKKNKDIEQIFNELLYHEFGYPSPCELVRKSFVMAGILTVDEARLIFLENRIDYKLLIELLYPKVKSIEELISTVKVLHASPEYESFCGYMKKLVGSSYDPLKSVVKLEELYIGSKNQHSPKSFEFGKTSIEKDSIIVRDALFGLSTYLKDSYVMNNLGVIKLDTVIIENAINKDLIS